MSNTDLLRAIDNFFGDTSCSQQDTRAGLEEARDKIEMLLESLPDH